jgi:hypothetical protein
MSRPPGALRLLMLDKGTALDNLPQIAKQNPKRSGGDASTLSRHQ